MKIAVIGSTGGIGKHVVRQALDAGHDVVALARTPDKLGITHPKLTVVKGDVLDAASLDPVIKGADAVLETIGENSFRKTTLRSAGTANVIAAMKKHGVKRIVLISACGVGDSADQARKSSFVFGRIVMPLLLRQVYADALRMEEIARQSGLDWTIVRPVGLSDEPISTRPIRAVTDGSKVKMSIPRADVARFMLDQLASRTYVSAAPTIDV